MIRSAPVFRSPYLWGVVGVFVVCVFLWIPLTSSAAPLAANEQQVALLSARFEVLKRMFEIIATSLFQRSNLAQVSSTSCDTNLTNLLGTGCHQMYTDSAGRAIYCDGPMTKSAKVGDTVTTSGCTAGSTTPYAGDANSCPGFAYSRWDSTGARYCQLNSSQSCNYFYPSYLTESNYSPTNCPTSTTTYPSGTPSTSLQTPTGVTATYRSGSNDVEVRWTDTSVGEDEYKIWRKVNGNWSYLASKTRPYDDGGSLGYYDTTILSGNTYEYMLKACVTSSGACSSDSTPALVTIPGATTSTDTSAPSAPGNVIATVSSSQVTLTWNASTDTVGVVSYKISRNSVYLATVGNVLTYTDSSVAPGTSYSYFVTALDAANNESISSVVSAYTSSGSTAGSLPNTPTGLTAYQSSYDAALSWNDASSNEDQYKIERKNTSASSWTQIGTTGIIYGGTGTYRDYSVPTGNYDYRVKACNSAGCSAESNTAFLFISSTPSTATTTPPSTTTSCDTNLTNLLGTGCHWMYTDSAGRAIYCDGPMTKSAKVGDTVTTSGCTAGSTTPYAGDANSCPGFAYSRWDSTGARYCQLNSSQSCNYFYPSYLTESNYSPTSCPASSPTTTPAPTTAPAGVTATYNASSKSVDLSWTDNTIEEEFKIYRRITGGIWSFIGTRPSAAGGLVYYADFGISPGVSYEYYVNACTSSGCSPNSNIAAISVPSTATISTTTPITTPAISYLFPSSGPIGTAVTINGVGFLNSGNRINFDTGVFLNVSSPDGRTLNFQVPSDRVPLCAQTEPRCLLPAPYNPVTSGIYTVWISNANGSTGSSLFTVTSSSIGTTTAHCVYYTQQTCTADPVCAWANNGCGSKAQCNDGIDNDGDGFIDYPRDTGCKDYFANSERPVTDTPPAVTLNTVTDLRAVYRASSNDIELTWTDSSVGEDEYKIWRNVNGAWSFLASKTRPYTDGGTIRFIDTFITPNTVYAYVIKACINSTSACAPNDSNAVSITSGGSVPIPTSCDSALLSLLGTGCHWMHSDSSGNPIYCDGNMTKSAKKGDTATTPGCYPGSIVSGPFAVDLAETYPKNGEQNVSAFVRIRVKFTKEVDTASTISQFFSLAPVTSPNSFLNGSFQFYGDSFEFIPSAPLQPGTTYSYKIFTSIKDKAGNPLQNSYSAIFTTSGIVSGVATLEGTVKDPDGKPLPGAFVEIYRDNYSYKIGLISGTDGTFRTSMAGGTYIVEVYPSPDKKGLLRPSPEKVVLLSGSTKTIVLQFGGSPKTVSGSVEFSDGSKVTDAEVGAYSLDSYEWRSTTVDSTGTFSLRLGGGKWKLGIHPKNPATALWSYDGPPIEIFFERNNASEFRRADFLVSKSNATLRVFTVDETGKAVADVGIVVDAISSGPRSDVIVSGSKPQFKISDSTGAATFTVRSDRYYIRSFVAPDRGYLNPPEQEIVTVPGKTVDIKVILKKKTSPTALSLKGVVKLEDGVPTDSFVWGWSEQGGYSSTFSFADGSFEFKVGPNERWHIGAGKAIKNIPHKSSEVIVDIGNVSASVEIILVKYEKEALSPPVVIKETATKQIVAQADDGAKATVPPQAASASGNISVEVTPTAEAPSQAGSKVVSTVYDVSIRDSKGTSITSLNSDIEIVIPYDEADLKAQGIREDDITPSFFNEKTGTWVKVDNFTIDKDKNVVIARVKHLTRFGLTAPATDSTPPLAPTKGAALALGEGKAKISWQNPKDDFAYARVYRNDKAGELGKVVAAEVKGSDYTDASLVDGVVYYYTIRAVDLAGNESNNKDQVSVKAVGTARATVKAPVFPSSGSKSGFLRNFSVGSSGDDIKTLQQILLKDGVYPEGLISGYFGNLTKRAVMRFQEKYADEILKPVGLSKGSGFIGAGTRKKLNELLLK